MTMLEPYDYDDRPTLAELLDPRDPFEGTVPCRHRCGVRFWGHDTPAARHHYAVAHPEPCTACGTRPSVGKRLEDGALVCWECVPETTNVLARPYAERPDQYPLLRRGEVDRELTW